jgi:TolB-like protein
LLYQFERYVLDTDRRELRLGADSVPVTPQVFDFLACVIERRGHVVSRDELFNAIWNGRVVSDSALSTCVSAARRAIGDSGEAQRLIKTVPRKGVRFVGTVREEPQADGIAAPAAVSEASQPLALPDKPSIAVLPFTNMSDDAAQDYFADGMAEEVITALSRCSWLFVIARNSSFTYKGSSVDIRQVGRELGVRYVLEGSVRRDGDRLRLTGQLIDATTGAHIWADRFDGNLSDVFGLQDRITECIVGAIEPRLQLAEIARLKQKPAVDLNAYDLLLRAQQFHYEFTEDSFAAALRCLGEALARDPTYPPALALAAYCYAERRLQGWVQDAEAEAVEGHRLALRAAELAGDDGNVLWMAGHAIRVLGNDFVGATEMLRLSVDLNPNSAMALTAAAWNEVLLSNPQSALGLLARAERLSPRDPRAWFMWAARAWAHFVAGQFGEAASWGRRALARNPRSTRTMRILAASLAKLGEIDQAKAVMGALRMIEPELTLATQRVRVRHWPEDIWEALADGLRRAGLPE